MQNCAVRRTLRTIPCRETQAALKRVSKFFPGVSIPLDLLHIAPDSCLVSKAKQLGFKLPDCPQAVQTFRQDTQLLGKKWTGEINQRLKRQTEEYFLEMNRKLADYQRKKTGSVHRSNPLFNPHSDNVTADGEIVGHWY